MSDAKIKIKMEGPGVWAINVLFEKNDSKWELVAPKTSATVDIPKGGSRWAFIDVRATKGTKFTIFNGKNVVFEGETTEGNEFRDFILIPN